MRNTRRELARVIKAVDEEIVDVFDAAFADVARNFSELFAMLFPGGSGRLVLTDPDDLLEHRHRDGSAAVGQDRAPAVAAVGRRALARPRWRTCSPCSAPGRRPST